MPEEQDYFVQTPNAPDGTVLPHEVFEVSEQVAVKIRAMQKAKRDQELRESYTRLHVPHIPRGDRQQAVEAYAVGETVLSYCGAPWHPTRVKPETVTTDWGDHNCCTACLAERYGRPEHYFKTKYFPKPWLEPVTYEQ